MSTTNRIQTLFRVVALLSVLIAGGGLAYMFVAEDGPYGFLPVVVPLGVAAVVLLLDLVITVIENVRTVSRGDATEAEIYLFKFRRSNFYIGLLFLLLGVVVLVVENGVLPGVPPLVRSLLSIAVQVFGGLTAVLITAAVFGAIWYALRQRSREAVYAGMAIWALVALTGIGYLRLNGSGAGLVIGGLLGTYYGAMARKATEMRYLGGQSTGTGQSHSSASSGGDGPVGRQAPARGTQTGRGPERPREPTPQDARSPRTQAPNAADSHRGSTPPDPGTATHRVGASTPEQSRDTKQSGSTGGESNPPQSESGGSPRAPGTDGAGADGVGEDGTGGDGAGADGALGDEAGRDETRGDGASPEPATDPDIYYDPETDSSGETSTDGTVEPSADSSTRNDDLYYDPDEADDGDADDGGR